MKYSALLSSIPFAAFILSGALAAAGDLIPPAGTPAPTMKPLSDIEPRTALRLADLPITISQPGSYYLAENIAFTTQNQSAITISASNVTIDLNGFTLAGPGKAAGTSGNAIISSGAVTNITIRNGIVRTWRGDGINLTTTTASSCLVENISANNNGTDGIECGPKTIVNNCISTENGGSGIVVRPGCIVNNCQAGDNALTGFVLFDGKITLRGCNSYNNTFDGIADPTANPANDCTIVACTVTENGRHGIELNSGNTISDCTISTNDADGIFVDDGNTIRGCTILGNKSDGAVAGDGNTISDCTISTNDADGISVGGGNTIRGCSLLGNKSDGIVVANGNTIESCTIADSGVHGIDANAGNTIRNNLCRTNGQTSPAGAGIVVRANYNRIDANQTASNDHGIYVNAGFNLIINNFSTNNAVNNYFFTGSNTIGPVITSTGTISAGAWANFSL